MMLNFFVFSVGHTNSVVFLEYCAKVNQLIKFILSPAVQQQMDNF